LAATPRENLNPEEIRDYAREQLKKNPDDILAWLQYKLDMTHADREEGFRVGDHVAANRHDAMVQKFAKAVEEISRLRRHNEVTLGALMNELEVRLRNAKAPLWRATHRHYKGTEYRLIKRVLNTEETEAFPAVVYDDERGQAYTLSLEKWESKLESGRFRYEPLVPEAGLPVLSRS